MKNKLRMAFFFVCGCLIASGPVIEKVIFLLLNCFCNFIKISVGHICVGLFLGTLYFVLFIYVSIPLPKPLSQGVRGLISSRGFRGDLSLVSSTFWWLLTFLGFWLHYSNLCPHFHFDFSPVIKIPSFPCCKDIYAYI